MSSRSPARKARSKPNGNSGLRLHVGGTLIPGKHLYIERPADRELFDLLRQGKYCNILSSRQMGKSSLMARTYQRLIEAGYPAVVADMQLIWSVKISDGWYQALLEEMVKDQGAPAHTVLKLAGIVKCGAGGTLVVRNELYRTLFTDQWASETTGA